MNFDHLNKIHDYWIMEIFPNLSHYMSIGSFDDYLKQMSFLPSCKWLKESNQVKVLRVPFTVDPAQFSKEYQKHCVAYCCPTKPEDGMHRVIYQISPTLHIEAAVWAWVANERVWSYLSIFSCFKEEKELLEFFTKIAGMRCTGDTEEKPVRGFGGI
jgi:hypothetical protein